MKAKTWRSMAVLLTLSSAFVVWMAFAGIWVPWRDTPVERPVAVTAVQKVAATVADEAASDASPLRPAVSALPEPSAPTPRAAIAEPMVEELFRLASGRELLQRIATARVSGDRVELKNATLAACLLAKSRVARGKHLETTAENQAAIGDFATKYCDGLDPGSNAVANAEAMSAAQVRGLYDPTSELLDAASESGSASVIYDQALDRGVPDAALTEAWLDALLGARNPAVASALALLATGKDGPFFGSIGNGPGHWPAERGMGITEAVAAIIVCRNGPMCAPATAYTMLACMERDNCAVGATLLDVRRDSISPQDWRIAESIVMQLRDRQRGVSPDGG